MSKSKRFFNVAGPCLASDHYMLDPFRGINAELMDLIDSKQYFVIHAARQTGKTTLLWELADAINAKGDYYALYCSLEAIVEFTDPKEGIPEIVKMIKNCIEEQDLPRGFAKNADYDNPTGVLKSTLVEYCRSLDKPFVLLFDEADCLSNGTLITFLRQLRDGYVSKGRVPFVHSVALVGMRNLGDYKAQIRPDSDTLGGMSPFNIVKKSFNLRNFTKAEITEFYEQHTAETGQRFETQAVDCIFEQTRGQPWLVNAIACECVEEITKKNYSTPITQELVELAVQNITLDRRTHITSIMERLREPRIRKIIEPLILGDTGVINRSDGDYQYVKDMGLVRDDNNRVEPANPIYAELIVRTLSWGIQDSIRDEYKDYEAPRYMKEGKIDMDFLIRDFQTYWRENSEI